jgi:hypothetical protein
MGTAAVTLPNAVLLVHGGIGGEFSVFGFRFSVFTGGGVGSGRRVNVKCNHGPTAIAAVLNAPSAADSPPPPLTLGATADGPCALWEGDFNDMENRKRSAGSAGAAPSRGIGWATRRTVTAHSGQGCVTHSTRNSQASDFWPHQDHSRKLPPTVRPSPSLASFVVKRLFNTAHFILRCPEKKIGVGLFARPRWFTCLHSP